jgi:hypothetical protein
MMNVAVQDMHLYHYDYDSGTNVGGTVKVVIPSLAAGQQKTIYLAKASAPFLPPLGDYLFDLSGANGSAPPGATTYGGSWTIQNNRLTSQDSAHTAQREAINYNAVLCDSFELEFDAWKVGQSDGTDPDYLLGVRYRCQNNWVTNSPDGYELLFGAKGFLELDRTASSTGIAQVVLSMPSSGLTFNTTDQLRIRMVVSGNDHTFAYRKNGSPWVVLYKVQDTQPGTPVTAAGSIALLNQRGQSQYANIMVHGIPTALTASNPGPCPFAMVSRLAPPVALETVTLDNTRGVALTNRIIEIAAASNTFDFTSVSASGQELVVLDSDGVSILPTSLRLWNQAVGLRLDRTWVGSQNDGAGTTYYTAGQVVVGDIGLVNGPHTLWSAGVIDNFSNLGKGQLDCYDKNQNKVWTFKAPTGDYVQSCGIGDVNGDGINEIAIGFRLQEQKAYVIKNDKSILWIWDNGGRGYIRMAEIGKMRNDLPGKEVAFGTSAGDAALCDHLGNQLWIKNFQDTRPGQLGQSTQGGIIDDLTGTGQNYLFTVQGNYIRKLDNTGTAVWTFQLAGVLTTGTSYQIASGHITSLSSKQLASVIAPHDGSSTFGGVYVVDDTGTLLWEKVTPWPMYTVGCADVNGDGYDEVIAGWGNDVTSNTGNQGWGGILVLDRFGNELACGSVGATPARIRFADQNGTGKKQVIHACQDMFLYFWDYVSGTKSGATLKATIPSLSAASTKTISIGKTAAPTLPPLGDYIFNFSGVNGTTPAGWNTWGGSWTVQNGRLTSQNSAETSAREAFELPVVASDSFELEFDTWKPGQGNGTSPDYLLGVRYRCQNNWVTNSPDGYNLNFGSKGGVTLSRTASSTGNVQTLYTAATAYTFNTTDQLRIRIVVAGNDHSLAFRKNSGPWTVVYKVQDTQAGTPITAPGSIAFVNNRGQSQYANVSMFTIPTAANVPGPGPAIRMSLSTATGYTLTPPSPSSGQVNQPSGTFTVTPNGTYNGHITITPSGGGLSAITLTFLNSSASQTFTITPTVAGTVTLTPTNDGGLSNPSSVTYTAILAPATTYTLTGPSGGAVGSQSSNFTVTPNGTYTGHITITPSGGGLSVANAITLTFSNSYAPQNFTITPPVVGTVILTPTNDGGLSNPAALSYQVVTATMFTLTGPSSSLAGMTSETFKVTPDAPYTGHIMITPFGGGLSTPIILTFNNSGAPQTFTITAPAVGMVVLTSTNDGGLINPPAFNHNASSTRARVMTSVKNTVTAQAVQQKNMDVVWYRDRGAVSSFASR